MFGLGTKRPPRDETMDLSVDSGAADIVFPTKSFRKFLGCLVGREAPVLLDLGPVAGSNVAFFGERLACKIFVEDIFADLARFGPNGGGLHLADYLAGRLPQADLSVDGILCWDVFDFVNKDAARALARELTRMLRPGGALLGFFGTTNGALARYTKYIVEDDYHLRHRPYGPVREKQHALLNRDIIKMFEGLLVSDSFLLKINTREILFRKPALNGRT